MQTLAIGVVGKTKAEARQWAEGRLPEPWIAFSQHDEGNVQGSRLCSLILLDGVAITPRARKYYRRDMIMSLGGAHIESLN